MEVLLVIVALSILILGHELGHFAVAKLFKIDVPEFGIGFPPRLWAKKVGDTEYSVNALPFGGFVRIRGENGEEEGEGLPGGAPTKTGTFTAVSTPKKVAVLAAGVAMNALLGWALLVAVYTIGAPQHLMIQEVAANSPAEAAHVKSADIVMRASAGGTTLADPVSSDAFVSLVGIATRGETALPVSLTIRRGTETIDLTLTPRLHPPEGEGALGVGLTELGFPGGSLWHGISEGTAAAWNGAIAIAVGIWDLVTQAFTHPAILQSVSGPVGIVSLAVTVGGIGAVYILELLAVISLNLAVLNLIPFPALDGGRILMALIERVRGRSVPKKLQLWVNAVGFAALILLMVVVTIHDIGNL